MVFNFWGVPLRCTTGRAIGSRSFIPLRYTKGAQAKPRIPHAHKEIRHH